MSTLPAFAATPEPPIRRDLHLAAHRRPGRLSTHRRTRGRLAATQPAFSASRASATRMASASPFRTRPRPTRIARWKANAGTSPRRRWACGRGMRTTGSASRRSSVPTWQGGDQPATAHADAITPTHPDHFARELPRRRHHAGPGHSAASRAPTIRRHRRCGRGPRAWAERLAESATRSSSLPRAQSGALLRRRTGRQGGRAPVPLRPRRGAAASSTTWCRRRDSRRRELALFCRPLRESFPMPIIDVELVVGERVETRAGLAQRLPTTPRRCSAPRQGRVWVRLRELPAGNYAENAVDLSPPTSRPWSRCCTRDRRPGPCGRGDGARHCRSGVPGVLPDACTSSTRRREAPGSLSAASSSAWIATCRPRRRHAVAFVHFSACRCGVGSRRGPAQAAAG